MVIQRENLFVFRNARLQFVSRFPILAKNAVFATDFVYNARFEPVGILLLFRKLEEAVDNNFCFESDFDLLLSQDRRPIRVW